MDSEGVDFTLLCGHREHYRFFGFEAAGVETIAQFEYYNAFNRRKFGEKEDFTFRAVEKDDTEATKKILSFYNTAAQRYLRPVSDAMENMTIYQTVPYLINDADGNCCGYLLYKESLWGITEIFLPDAQTLPRVVNSFMAANNLSRIMLHLAPTQAELQMVAYEAAEEVHTEPLCLLNIRRPERLLAACLNLKQKSGGSLPHGELVLDTPWGKLLIRNDDVFTVEKAEREADAVIDSRRIYSLLFGPAPASVFCFPQIPEKFRCWFPVPFYIYRVDHMLFTIPKELL